MNTKEQKKPISESSVRSTASQARENSQINAPKHTIVSSILTDLMKKQEKKSSVVGNHYWTSEASEFEQRGSNLKTDTNIVNSNKNLDLGFLEIKDKKTCHYSIESVDQNPCWKVNKSICFKLKYWKHIRTSKLLWQWTEQYHSTPKHPWGSDQERKRNFGRTSETMIWNWQKRNKIRQN